MNKKNLQGKLINNNIKILLVQIDHIMYRLDNIQLVDENVLQDYIYSYLPRLRSNMVKLLKNFDSTLMKRKILSRTKANSLIQTYNSYKIILNSLKNSYGETFTSPVYNEFLGYTNECIKDYSKYL